MLGETLGLVDDKILTAGFVQIFTRRAVCFFFGLLLIRYNLVQVELDQIGEGMFRDIEAPVLLLSQESNVLRCNPKAMEVFGLDEWMSRPEHSRSVTQIIPGFQSSTSQFDVSMDTRLGPKKFQCKLSNVYQMDEILGSMLVIHDLTHERDLARMKRSSPQRFPMNSEHR